MWGFLGSIGSALGKGASAVGHGLYSGAQKVGTGIGAGVKKIGAMGDEETMMPDLGPGGTGGFAGNQGLPKLSRFGGSDGDAMGRRVARELGDATQSNTGVRNSAEWTPPPSGAIQRPVGGMEPPSRLQPVFSREQIRQAGAPVEAASDYDAPPTAVMPRPMMKPEMFTGMSSDKPATRSFNPLEPIAPTPGAPRMPQVQATEPTPLLRGEPSLVAPDAPPMMDRTPGAQPPRMDMNRRGVPIPAMPNRGTEPTPYTDYDAARYDSIMSHEKPGGGFKRSAKSIFQNALLGAGRGFAANPQGGIGSLVGGALGGGLGATLNPQAGYEQTFDAGPGRQIEQKQSRGDARAKIEAEREKQRLDNEYRKAQTDELNRRHDMVVTPPGAVVLGKDGKPIFSNPARTNPASQPAPVVRVDENNFYRDARTGDFIRDKTTGQPIRAPQKPEKLPSIQDVTGQLDDEEGTVESIAQSSFNDPGRQQSLRDKLSPVYRDALQRSGPDFSKLPQVYQQILSQPIPTDSEGQKLYLQAENARNQLINQHQQTLIAAQNELQQLEQRELAEIRRDTQEKRKRDASLRRTGNGTATRTTGASGGGQPTRATVSRAAAEGYAKEKGVSLDEAIQRFAAKGVQVK